MSIFSKIKERTTQFNNLSDAEKEAVIHHGFETVNKALINGTVTIAVSSAAVTLTPVDAPTILVAVDAIGGGNIAAIVLKKNEETVDAIASERADFNMKICAAVAEPIGTVAAKCEDRKIERKMKRDLKRHKDNAKAAGINLD